MTFCIPLSMSFFLSRCNEINVSLFDWQSAWFEQNVGKYHDSPFSSMFVKPEGWRIKSLWIQRIMILFTNVPKIDRSMFTHRDDLFNILNVLWLYLHSERVPRKWNSLLPTFCREKPHDWHTSVCCHYV